MKSNAQQDNEASDEKDLFEAVKNNNPILVNELLKKPAVNVNCLDEHGMTTLQHAAFKGKPELCNILLANGADVNSNEHENGYTTLMFAALSGNVEVTKIILDAGAKTSPVNSVGRTAAQMAAFVGQHGCVSLINNYFSLEKLDFYTRPQGFEKDPKLPPELVSTLHRLILHNNIHPVKLSLFLKGNKGLVDEARRIIKVLETICEKEMKSTETNDILAMKMHYISSVLQMCKKWEDEHSNVGINGFIRMLMKEREDDGAQIGMEKFLRETIRVFPYHDSELFIQIVRNVADVKVGDDPSSYMLLTQAINGARMVDSESPCSACGEPKAEKKCAACKVAHYCNQDCQKLHWFTHKKRCKMLAEALQKEMELNKQSDEVESKQTAKTETNDAKVAGPAETKEDTTNGDITVSS